MFKNENPQQLVFKENEKEEKLKNITWKLEETTFPYRFFSFFNNGFVLSRVKNFFSRVRLKKKEFLNSTLDG